MASGRLRLQGRHPPCRQGAGAIAPVTVPILMELGVTDPGPALKAPAIPHLWLQGFWADSQPGEKQMGGLEGLVVTPTGGDHLHDPAIATPGLADLLWRLFDTQRPGDLAAVGSSMILCLNRGSGASPGTGCGWSTARSRFSPVASQAWLIATPRAAEFSVSWARETQSAGGHRLSHHLGWVRSSPAASCRLSPAGRDPLHHQGSGRSSSHG